MDQLSAERFGATCAGYGALRAPVIGYAGMTHLGINSAVTAAEKGYETVCYDPDADRIAALARQELPVAEPDLAENCRKVPSTQ